MARRKSSKPPTPRQQAARAAFAARSRARPGGRQLPLRALPPRIAGYLPAPSYAMAPPVVQAEFLTAPAPRRAAPKRKRRSPMARRRTSLTRRASNSIGRARRSLGGANRYDRGRGVSKFKLKEAFAETLVETLGGAASTTLDEVSKLTENTVDDSILFRLGLKSVAGMGLKWLFNRNKWAIHFAAGMQGDAGGSALRDAGKKLAAKK